MKLTLECGECVQDSSKSHYIFAQTDLSGSMSDFCKDGRTKIQHIIHVWSNIIRYFANNPEYNVHLQLNGFNTHISEIFKLTLVTKDNQDELIKAVESMYASYSTNIEIAIKDLLKSFESVDSDAKCIIMMTDGEANEGERNGEALARLLPEDIRAAFIAVGVHHNARLMNALGTFGANSSNWLINNIEKSSDVYAEIIAKWTNEVFQNVVLKIENGFFYDWKTSSWVSELKIGNLSSLEKKRFHIKTFVPNDVIIIIEDGNPFREIICSDADEDAYADMDMDADLTQDMFRLCVQKIMHLAKEAESEIMSPPPPPPNVFLRRNTSVSTSSSTESDVKLKKELLELLENMELYLLELPEGERDLMESLVNDVKVTMNQIGKNTQYMFISARGTSQGRQQTQTISDENETMNRAYTTPVVERMMRDISTSIIS